MAKNINNVLIPNVTSLPGQKKVDNANSLKQGQKSDFQKLLNDQISLDQTSNGISLSTHAVKRINERNIDIDGEEFVKLQTAIGKLRDKGGKNSLVISDKAAYIIDVANNKVVTAVDKDSLSENVFTKIDSTMIVN